MSYIKDAIDLLQDLNDRADSREFASEVREIMKVIMDVQKEQIAIEGRNRKLVEENSQLKRRIAELEKVDKSSVTFGRDKDFRMSGQEIKILQAIGNREGQTTSQLSQEITVGEQTTQHFLDKLYKKNFVDFPIIPDVDKTYNLTAEGRAWLAEANLLD